MASETFATAVSQIITKRPKPMALNSPNFATMIQSIVMIIVLSVRIKLKMGKNVKGISICASLIFVQRFQKISQCVPVAMQSIPVTSDMSV